MINFDAASWVLKAEIAGYGPIVCYEANGRRRIYFNHLDIDHSIEMAAFESLNSDQKTAVVEVLEKIGSVALFPDSNTFQ